MTLCVLFNKNLLGIRVQMSFLRSHFDIKIYFRIQTVILDSHGMKSALN